MGNKIEKNKATVSLAEYLHRTKSFELINGKVINVRAIDYTTFNKLISLSDQEGASASEANSKTLELVADYLSNNTEEVKVETSDLEKYPNSAINRIYQEILLDANNVATDPN